MLVDMFQWASVGVHHNIKETWTTRKDRQQNAATHCKVRRLVKLVSTGLCGLSVMVVVATVSELTRFSSRGPRGMPLPAKG